MIDSSVIISSIAAIIAALALLQSIRVTNYTKKKSIQDKLLELRLKFVELKVNLNAEIIKLDESEVLEIQEYVKFLRESKSELEEAYEDFEQLKLTKIRHDLLSNVEVKLYEVTERCKFLSSKYANT